MRYLSPFIRETFVFVLNYLILKGSTKFKLYLKKLYEDLHCSLCLSTRKQPCNAATWW